MKPIAIIITVALLAIATAPQIAAQNAENAADSCLRPVVSATMIDIGHERILDSYLSPITYAGTAVALSYERMQAMPHNPERWTAALEAGVDYALTHNPADNHTTHALMVGLQWAMMHRWNDVLTPRLNLLAGPMAEMRGGAIYNEIGSNNVVSAKARVSLGIRAQASYPITIRSLPVTLRYQAALPVIGAYFAPDYDEAYYEIYLGNRKNLVHCAWWASRFDMTNFISADLHLGATTLRIGYRNRFEQSWIQNVNTRIVTHSFVLGLGGEWITLSKKKNNATQRHIFSPY